MPNWKKLIVSGSDASLNSLEVNQASGSFSGSFQGDGSQLTGITVDAATTVEDSFTSQTSISITHNFETKNIIVSVYNSDDEQIIPQSVTTTTNNTVDIVFQSATSGRVVVVRGGHILSGSAATASLALELSNLATASFAITASHALNVPDTASHALTAVTSSIADELSQLATASFADNATSASYALYAVSASHEIVLETSSSFAETASLAINLSPEATASQADNATTASFAITASHALNVPATSSHALTAVSASIADELSQLATASFAITASHALNVPDTASHALTAVTASHTAGTASIANNAVTASFATLAGTIRSGLTASFADRATSASIADELSLLATASHALTAVTASHALNVPDTSSFSLNADSASVAARATTLSADATASIADRATTASFADLAGNSRNADSSSVAARATTLSSDATASFADRATSASIADDIKDGAITNAKLVNDSITLGTTEVTLGTTIGTLSGLDAISATTGTFVLQVYESSSTIITSGSNIFGNDQNDIQQITGSLKQSGSYTLSGSLLQSNGTISGSFEGDGSGLTGITADSADSSSVAARATTLSADATASHALTAVTASHTAGTASISNYATSASFAITASHLLGGAGNSGSFSGSFQGDGSELTGITVDASTLVNATFISQTSFTASHDLDSTNLIITVLNNNNEVLIPENIRILDADNVGFDFATSTSGKYVLAKGGHIVSGSIASASIADVATLSRGGSGSFSGSFEGDGTNLTGVASPTGSYTGSFTGSMLVSDHVLPTSDEAYDLGSSDKKFRDLYLSGSTIYLGDSKISIDPVHGGIQVTDAQTGIPAQSLLSGSFTGSFSGSYSGSGNSLYKNITVTVVDDGGNKYAFNGVTAPTLSLNRGELHRFDLSDSSNSGHPFAFRLLDDTSYTTGVTTVGTAGNAGAYVEFDIDFATSSSLKYYCTVHGNGMGNRAQIIDVLGGIISGSFSGSFQGDGSNLTGVASPTGSYTGSFTGSILGDVIGTASVADLATTSSFADELSQLATASHALTSVTSSFPLGGVINGSVAGNTITLARGDGSTFDLVTTGEQSVESASIANIATTVRNGGSGSFSGSFQGDGSNITGIVVESSTITSQTFSSVTSVTASHNFGSENVVVQVYDSSNNLIVPSNIRVLDSNEVGVDFASTRSGRVTVSKGGHLVSGSIVSSSNLLVTEDLTVEGSASLVASQSVNNNTASGSLSFWQGSQAEYDLVSASADNNTIYFVIE